MALFFDGLTDEELKAIKHWIKNTTEERLAQKATEVLDLDQVILRFRWSLLKRTTLSI